MPEMTALAASGRLQNVNIKYGTKLRKIGPAGQRVEKFDDSLTYNQQSL